MDNLKKKLTDALSKNKLLVISVITGFLTLAIDIVFIGGFSGYHSGDYYFIPNHGTHRRVASTAFYLAYILNVLLILSVLGVIFHSITNLINNPPPSKTFEQQQQEAKRFLKKFWPIFALFFILWISVVYYGATHSRYENLSPHQLAVTTGYENIAMRAEELGQRLERYYWDNRKLPSNYKEARKQLPEFAFGLPETSAIRIDKVIMKELDGTNLPFKVQPFEFSIHTIELMEDGSTKPGRKFYYFPQRDSKWVWDITTESELPTDNKTILDNTVYFKSSGQTFIYIQEKKAQR